MTQGVETCMLPKQLPGEDVGRVALAFETDAVLVPEYTDDGMLPNVDLYEKVIIPEEVKEAYDIPITRLDDKTICIRETPIELEGHCLFMFNSLMYLRGQPKIRRADIAELGFKPEGSADKQYRTFRTAMDKVRRIINAASEAEVIQTHGQKNGAFYSVSESFGFSTLGDSNNTANEGVQRAPIKLAIAKSARSPERDAENRETYDIIDQLIQVYGKRAEVRNMLRIQRKPNTGPPRELDALPIKELLEEAKNYRLLTPKQERILAGIIGKGLETFGAIKSQGRDLETATTEEIKDFARLVAAHRTFTICNARLITYVIKRFGYHKNPGFERDDALREGFEGLTAAINGFDIRKGATFSTYATRLIRGAVSRSIVQQVPTVQNEADDGGKMLIDTLADESASVAAECQVDALSAREELNMLFEQAELGDEELAVIGLRYGVVNARTVATVPKKHRSTLVYGDIQGNLTDETQLSYRKIGAILSIDQQRVASLEKSALAKLALGRDPRIAA